jgi:hypothetical protein
MPDPVRKVPPAPSRRNLPHVIPPPDDLDTPASWLQRLAGSVHTMASELHGKALGILKDGDLTATGQAKAIAREAAKTINKFQSRIAEEGRRLDGERKLLKGTITAKTAGDRISEARQAEWRAVLRAMSRDERIDVLRQAAAGEIDAADEIVATVLGASSPMLCGLQSGDPILNLIRDEQVARHAAAEMSQIAELDATTALASQALQWLDGYAVDLLDGDSRLLRDAQAVDKGHRPLSELTVGEKVARMEAGKERGGDLRDALYEPAPGEAAAGSSGTPLHLADVERFARLPLSEKVALGDQHGGDLAAAIRAAAKEGMT